MRDTNQRKTCKVDLSNAKKRGIAIAMAVTLTAAVAAPGTTDVNAAIKGFKVSKKAGTYRKNLKTTVKATKGYTVYYTNSKKFDLKKKLLSGKKKSFTVKKTTTFKFIALTNKKAKDVTAEKLNSSSYKKLVKSYKYVIKKNSKAEKENGSQDESKNTNAPNNTVAPSTTTAPKNTDAPEDYKVPTSEIKSVTTNMYYTSVENMETTNLYFKGDSDIPYVSLEERSKELGSMFNNAAPNKAVTYKSDEDTFSYVRDNGFDVKFDFKKNTIYFTDVNGFFREEDLFLFSTDKINPQVKSLFKLNDSSYGRFGSDTKFDLNNYGIRIITDGKNHYIPLQTYSDLFLSKALGGYMVYNGQNVFYNGSSSFSGDLKDLYYSAPKRKMSDEFVKFNYGELCLGLDYLYGLKEVHGIKNFDRFFEESGLKSLLNKNDMTSVDTALLCAIHYYLDDGHSGFGSYSYNSDFNGNEASFDELVNKAEGMSRKRTVEKVTEIVQKFKEYNKDGIEAYKEVGDTAYITFMNYTGTGLPADYTKQPTEDEIKTNTYRLMQYACAQILRENSPIKRVVMDLSLNGGGEVNAAIYVVGTFLGKGMVTSKYMLTGALSNVVYDIDTNLDGEFDEKDTLAGKGLDLYCITSGYTFSSANMTACIFKDSGKVTLIGQTSGGGSCAVQSLCTASGATFQISGMEQFSFMKNGAFYDVDRGAEPDIYVKDIGKLYDREYANKLLDKYE